MCVILFLLHVILLDSYTTTSGVRVFVGDRWCLLVITDWGLLPAVIDVYCHTTLLTLHLVVSSFKRYIVEAAGNNLLLRQCCFDIVAGVDRALRLRHYELILYEIVVFDLLAQISGGMVRCSPTTVDVRKLQSLVYHVTLFAWSYV